MKYEYAIDTWGGIFNDEHIKKHNKSPGLYFFNSEEKRTAYINELKNIGKKLKGTLFVYCVAEGFNVRNIPCLHRVSRYKGKDYHTENKLLIGFDFASAEYHLKNKWYPGHNDYPLGVDFDYDNEEFEIVQEWISGSFTIDV